MISSGSSLGSPGSAPRTRASPAATVSSPPLKSLPSAGHQYLDRAAVAANQANRTGDLDAARQLTDQAAVLDPSRADLWQQRREQIAGRSLILDAQAAHADGDHQRVQELLWPGLPARPADASHLGR